MSSFPSSNRPVTRTVIRDWAGLVTSADRADVPPGAGTVQVNCQSERSGELRVRRGLSRVYFDLSGFLVSAESVLVSESVTLLRSISFAISDVVTITDTASAFSWRELLINDSVDITESVSAIRFFTAQPSDSVTITEAVVKLKTVFANVFDTVTLSEFAVTNVNTLWVSDDKNSVRKLHLQSGQFSSMMKTSQTVFAASVEGISWNGTNTPWTGISGTAKLLLQSGLFSSVIKTSQTTSGNVPDGISWDGENTPFVYSDGVTSKLMLQSGNFSSVVKTSRDVSEINADASGISWSGSTSATPWAGGATPSKLFLQSGQFTGTLRTSLSVSFFCNGVSWDGQNTLYVDFPNLKLKLQSGQFSTTLKTSQSVARLIRDIETQSVRLRLGA